MYPSSQCPGYQGIYFKSWIGSVPCLFLIRPLREISESHGTPPNGGGGGDGYCRNVTVRDVYMEDIMHPIAVDTS